MLKKVFSFYLILSCFALLFLVNFNVSDVVDNVNNDTSHLVRDRKNNPNNYDDLDIDYDSDINKAAFVYSLQNGSYFPLDFIKPVDEYPFNNLHYLELSFADYDESLEGYYLDFYFYPVYDFSLNTIDYAIDLYFVYSANYSTEYFFVDSLRFIENQLHFNVDGFSWQYPLNIDEFFYNFTITDNGYSTFYTFNFYFDYIYVNDIHYQNPNDFLGFTNFNCEYYSSDIFEPLFNYLMTGSGEFLGSDWYTSTFDWSDCPEDIIFSISNYTYSYYSFTQARIYYEDFGFNTGFNDGLNEGYDTGFEDGSQSGYEDGYSQGFTNGENVGLENGYNNGYENGYDAGYDTGYSEGYNTGYDDGIEFVKNNSAFAGQFYVDNLSNNCTTILYDAGNLYVDTDSTPFRDDWYDNGFRFRNLMYNAYNQFYGNDLLPNPPNDSNTTLFIFSFDKYIKSEDLDLTVYGFNKIVFTDSNNIDYVYDVPRDFQLEQYVLNLNLNGLLIRQIGFYTDLNYHYDNETDFYDNNIKPYIISNYVSDYLKGYNDGVNTKLNEIIAKDREIKYLQERLENLTEGEFTLANLFWSIGSIPFETIKTIWNFEFLGVNLTQFFTGLLTSLILIFLIKHLFFK